MCKWVLYVGGLVLLLGLASYLLYKISTREKYKKLRDTGNFPINYQHVTKTADKKPDNKYDSHRYKQRRRYNSRGQYRD
tara:strand:+ start:415 stop:651 length:237 start_codon:yes stop_codon:yes gene_type:complete